MARWVRSNCTPSDMALRFFFDTIGAKKKLAKRNAVTRALPLTHHLLKKVDENFNKKSF
jgi:hypothetical protein